LGESLPERSDWVRIGMFKENPLTILSIAKRYVFHLGTSISSCALNSSISSAERVNHSPFPRLSALATMPIGFQTIYVGCFDGVNNGCFERKLCSKKVCGGFGD
jgi:hypothetical protein